MPGTKSCYREIARVLGGAVGTTRPACDEGWTPVMLQVGQSGKVVSLVFWYLMSLFTFASKSFLMRQARESSSGAKRPTITPGRRRFNFLTSIRKGILGTPLIIQANSVPLL